MEVNQIIEARKMLEQELFRLINHFELNSGCTRRVSETMTQLADQLRYTV